MKKIFKYAMLFAACATLSTGLSSCSDNNNDDDATTKLAEQNAAIKTLTGDYLDNVVYTTYTNLANSADKLNTKITDFNTKLKAGTAVTDTEVEAICDNYKEARKYWEESEAFLYGAASDFNIDPHIDSWPLDVNMLKKILVNSDVLSKLDADNGVEYARKTLNEDGQLGFHGIEFIFFRDGKARTASYFNNNQTEVYSGYIEESDGIKAQAEVIYAKAVAGDLRDKTFQLEVAWEGTSAPTAHQTRVKECQDDNSFGTDYGTTTSTGLNYGADLLAAGTSQSSLASSSLKKVLETIFVGGCSNICSEVSDQKMGQAYRASTGTGSGDDDPNYIESPYSYNSFTDFYDNIMSIQNSLYGNIEAADGKYESTSVMAYLNKYYVAEATLLQTKLTAALAALNACKNSGTPFVKNPGASCVKTAMQAVSDLDDELNVASNTVLKN